MICQLQNAKSNFSKLSKVHALQKKKKKKKKKKKVYLYIHFVENFALILNSKIVFKKFFRLKLSILKNTLLALNKLDKTRYYKIL